MAPPRVPASARAIVAFLVAASGLSVEVPRVCYGSPFTDVRSGGLALTGAASPHPAAVFVNPAALDFFRYDTVRFYTDGTLRLSHGSIRRAPIDLGSGEPASAPQNGNVRAFDKESLLEPFPQLAFVFTTNLGSDSIVASLAANTPTARTLSLAQGSSDRTFDPATQGPSRYHGVDLLEYHLHLTLAASYHLASYLAFGVSLTLVFAEADFAFVSDAALDGGSTRSADSYVALDDCGGAKRCDYESDRAAQAVRIDGTGLGLKVGAGILVHPHPSLYFGAAYNSQPVGANANGLVVSGDAWVRRSAAMVENAGATLRSPVARDATGRGTIRLASPDSVHVGATWQVLKRLALDAQARWTRTSTYEALDMRLIGAEFRKAPAVATRLRQFLGLDDQFAFQLGSRWAISNALALESAAMLETSAVPKGSITATTVDALKLDVFSSLAVSIGSGFRIGIGYGFQLLPPQTVDNSNYFPAAATACVDASFNVDASACQRVAAGQGLASSAGDYTLFTHRVGISLGYSYQAAE